MSNTKGLAIHIHPLENAHGVGPLWWGGEWWSSLGYAITCGMRQPRNFATDRCCHLVSRIANRAFYLSAEAGGWRTTFLRFSPKGQGGRSRFATCSDFPVRTTSRRSTLRRCARRATLRRLARRIRIRLGWSTRSRRRGVGRSRMGRLLHHSPLHQRGQTLWLTLWLLWLSHFRHCHKQAIRHARIALQSGGPGGT